MQVEPTQRQEPTAEVLGFSLNIAIETLSEIDRLGKSFLQELGVESFDSTLFYPYQYRLNFFQEIFDRLGWPPQSIEDFLEKIQSVLIWIEQG